MHMLIKQSGLPVVNGSNKGMLMFSLSLSLTAVKIAPRLQPSSSLASPSAGSIDLEDSLAVVFIVLATVVVIVALILLIW